MLSIVNGDGDFDNFISIFYNIEYSLMSKVKRKEKKLWKNYKTKSFKPPMSKVKHIKKGGNANEK